MIGSRPLALAAVLLVPRAVEACSALPCAGSYTLPADGGRAPASLRGFVVRRWGERGPASSEASDEGITLVGPGDRNIAFDVVAGPGPALTLEPTAPLSPGTYVLTASSACAFEPRTPHRSTIELTPAVMPPTELGVLVAGVRVREPVRVETTGGACSVEIDAVTLEVGIRLAPSAAPWADILQFRTLVDGAPWSASPSLVVELPVGASWQGRGRDRLYAACDSPPPGARAGLPEGRHTVVMQAQLPGSEQVWATDPIVVDLDCSVARPDGLAPTDGGCRCPAAGGRGALGVLLAAGGLLAAAGRRRFS